MDRERVVQRVFVAIKCVELVTKKVPPTDAEMLAATRKFEEKSFKNLSVEEYQRKVHEKETFLWKHYQQTIVDRLYRFRPLLEHARTVFRVYQHTFGKIVVHTTIYGYMESFLRIFTAIKDISSKKDKITEWKTIIHTLNQCDIEYERLDSFCTQELLPRLQSKLGPISLEEMVQAESSHPFGLLEQYYIHQQGSDQFANRCKKLSRVLGGRMILNRPSSQTNPKKQKNDNFSQ